MRPLFLLLLCLLPLFAVELIYVSNDTEVKNLEQLEKKYKQPLLINGNHIYLIPEECRLMRYFGGASQTRLQLIEGPEQTQELVITQEIFDAKDKSDIEEKIQVQKAIALVEGKIPKAFLEDQDGRGYGGASEIPLDFSFQKTEAQTGSAKPVNENDTPAKAESYSHPRCELLKDGSGYNIEGSQQAQLYSNKKFTPIDKTILFE